MFTDLRFGHLEMPLGSFFWDRPLGDPTNSTVDTNQIIELTHLFNVEDELLMWSATTFILKKKSVIPKSSDPGSFAMAHL
jgi:hypothetical protein